MSPILWILSVPRTGAGLKSSPCTPGVPMSSVRVNPLAGALPVLLTRYVQVIGVPTGRM
jgi:hypothetical protein